MQSVFVINECKDCRSSQAAAADSASRATASLHMNSKLPVSKRRQAEKLIISESKWQFNRMCSLEY